MNNAGIGTGKGVFNELKLSEILQQELDKVREKVETLRENLEIQEQKNIIKDKEME